MLPRKVWYVLPVIPYQPQESPKPGQILGGGPVLYSSYLLGISRHALTADNVSQVLNLRLRESALGGFELEAGTLELFEYLPQTIDVSQKVWGAHNDVIKVYQQCLPMESTKDLFHEPLERGGGGGQPKGEHLPFPQPVPGDEHHLLLGVGTERDLSVDAQQV